MPLPFTRMAPWLVEAVFTVAAAEPAAPVVEEAPVLPLVVVLAVGDDPQAAATRATATRALPAAHLRARITRSRAVPARAGAAVARPSGVSVVAPGRVLIVVLPRSVGRPPAAVARTPRIRTGVPPCSRRGHARFVARSLRWRWWPSSTTLRRGARAPRAGARAPPVGERRPTPRAREGGPAPAPIRAPRSPEVRTPRTAGR